MQPLQTLTTAQRSKFWIDVPLEWAAVTGEERMCGLGDFFEQLLALLRNRVNNPHFKKRKRDKNTMCNFRYQDGDNFIYREFWRGLDSHGATFEYTSDPFQNNSKWYLVLLPVTDDNIIHRIVRSLEKEWPDSSLNTMSVAMVLYTLGEECAVAFMFSMSKTRSVQKVVSVLGKGVIACTMLPWRVAKCVEWFFNANYRDGVQEQVTLAETWNDDILEQQVIVIVTPMHNYMNAVGAAEAGEAEDGAAEAGEAEEGAAEAGL
jgi:hypothetical protein